MIQQVTAPVRFTAIMQRLVDDALPVDARWCAIHATHMTTAETEALARSGAVAGAVIGRPAEVRRATNTSRSVLPEAVRRRFLQRYANRVNGEGEIVIAADEHREQRLLRVQAVLRLVEDHRHGRVDDLVGHFLAAPCRQAVEEMCMMAL